MSDDILHLQKPLPPHRIRPVGSGCFPGPAVYAEESGVREPAVVQFAQMGEKI